REVLCTPRVLLLDYDHAHAERLAERLLVHSLEPDTQSDLQQALIQLHRNSGQYEVVLINVSDNSPWLTTLRKLQDACRQPDGHSAPLFLCVSKIKKPAAFVLRIEKMGARYVCER